MLTRILVCCLVQLISVLSVDGVCLSLNPPSMVIGSSTVIDMTSLNMQCSNSGTLYIKKVLELKLSRRKITEPTFVGIATMNFDGLATFDETLPSDIKERSPNITASLDIGQRSGTMTLLINAQGLACTDEAELQCSLIYADDDNSILTVTDNMKFTVKIDGVTLTLNPPSMLIGSSTVNPSMSLIVQCFSSGTLDIDTLTQLKLSRRKFTESTFTGIASMKFDGLAKLEPTVPSDIQIRQPNITGSVDTGKTSGTMTLSINAQGLTCTDQAEFNCSLNYIDTNQYTQTVTDNKNFTVITVPSEVLIDSPEYYDVNGNALQLSNNSVLPAGTRIKYRSTANIGSVPDGEIIWERSPEMGTMNSFIPYIPAQPTDIVQETSRPDGCIYRRTSTMYYNLTKLDEDGISFRCRARSYLNSQLYEALANQQYRAFAAPSGGTTGSTTQPASSGGTTGHSTQTVLVVIVSLYQCIARTIADS